MINSLLYKLEMIAQKKHAQRTLQDGKLKWHKQFDRRLQVSFLLKENVVWLKNLVGCYAYTRHTPPPNALSNNLHLQKPYTPIHVHTLVQYLSFLFYQLHAQLQADGFVLMVLALFLFCLHLGSE